MQLQHAKNMKELEAINFKYSDIGDDDQVQTSFKRSVRNVGSHSEMSRSVYKTFE